MNIYVLDHNFRRQHIIDIYESLIWTDRYGESGDFELYLPTSQEAIDILQKDMYLSIDTSNYIKIIEDIEITSNNEDGKKLKVTGRTLDSILDRRIIWGLTELNVSLQDGIEELLNKNLINPDDPNRKIDNFVMKKSTDSAITDLMIDAQYFGENLYDTIVALCKANYLGFRVLLNENNQMQFELYQGVDRTFNQTERAAVEFSPRFDNLINSEYVRSDKTLKNVSLIGGEGEGAERKTSSVYTNAGLGILNLEGMPKGMNRREMFTDANTISSKVTDADNNDITLTNEEYIEKLNHKGMQDLADANGVTTFNGEVNSYVQSEYNKDFFLGDLVQIENEFKMKGVTRITEVIFSDNTQDGVQLFPTFKSDDSESWNGTAIISDDFHITETLYTKTLRNSGQNIFRGKIVTYVKMDKVSKIETSGIDLKHYNDDISWVNKAKIKTYPTRYGGLRWNGDISRILIFDTTETAANNDFQLNISLSDNQKSSLNIINSNNEVKAKINASGRADFTSLWINDKEYRIT